MDDKRRKRKGSGGGEGWGWDRDHQQEAARLPSESAQRDNLFSAHRSAEQLQHTAAPNIGSRVNRSLLNIDLQPLAKAGGVSGHFH